MFFFFFSQRQLRFALSLVIVVIQEKVNFMALDKHEHPPANGDHIIASGRKVRLVQTIIFDNLAPGNHCYFKIKQNMLIKDLTESALTLNLSREK